MFDLLPPAGHELATKHDVEQLGSDLQALRQEIRADHQELIATFRGELNEALIRQNRSMLLGLSGTLVSTIGLAAVLSRML